MILLLQRVSAVLLSFGLAVSAAGGQVLARPGWAGSGVAPEPWWVRAVFYRLDPARFQDSDGDGRGDLRGVAQRLDYLQSLGIDAVVLDGAEPLDPEALGDLVRGASERHLRVLVRVPDALQSGPRDSLLASMQAWLGAGVAGVWAPKPGGGTAVLAYPGVIAAVRGVMQHFPGERVLLMDPAPISSSATPERARSSHGGADVRSAQGALLVSAAVFPPVAAGVGPLRSSLVAASGYAGSGANPLLRLAEAPATNSKDAVASAALLLGSRGAVILDAGAEIGLDLYPAGGHGGADEAPVMQWTPSNRTSAPVEHSAAAAKPALPGTVTEFGAYHPYVPPPRGIGGPPPSSLHVVPDMNVPAALPDPDSLPGFTSGTLAAKPVDGAKLNVTTEDRDPKSLLNMYRELIGLHHGNAALRNGTQVVLNHDADGVVLWVRRAPAGSRTVADVVIAANVSERPVSLVIDGDLQSLGIRPGALRMLFGSAPEAETGESTHDLRLPPHGVFVGEVYRAGASARQGHRFR